MSLGDQGVRLELVALKTTPRTLPGIYTDIYSRPGGPARRRGEPHMLAGRAGQPSAGSIVLHGMLQHGSASIMPADKRAYARAGPVEPVAVEAEGQGRPGQARKPSRAKPGYRAKNKPRPNRARTKPARSIICHVLQISYLQQPSKPLISMGFSKRVACVLHRRLCHDAISRPIDSDFRHRNQPLRSRASRRG